MSYIIGTYGIHCSFIKLTDSENTTNSKGASEVF